MILIGICQSVYMTLCSVSVGIVVDRQYDPLVYFGMDSLRLYLKTLTFSQKTAYAQSCHTSLGYLRKAIYQRQKLGGELCRLLDEESNGAVPRESLRPDIWPIYTRPPVVAGATQPEEKTDECNRDQEAL